jgi:hypothetical protein
MMQSPPKAVLGYSVRVGGLCTMSHDFNRWRVDKINERTSRQSDYDTAPLEQLATTQQPVSRNHSPSLGFAQSS